MSAGLLRSASVITPPPWRSPILYTLGPPCTYQSIVVALTDRGRASQNINPWTCHGPSHHPPHHLATPHPCKRSGTLALLALSRHAVLPIPLVAVAGPVFLLAAPPAGFAAQGLGWQCTTPWSSFLYYYIVLCSMYVPMRPQQGLSDPPHLLPGSHPLPAERENYSHPPPWSVNPNHWLNPQGQSQQRSCFHP